MSDRNLHANMVTEIVKSEVEPVLLCELDFDSSPLRLWSGVGSLTWDSKTWLGTGDKGRASTVDETVSIEAKSVSLEFNGIDSNMISTALTEDYQGRDATLWLALISGGSVVSNPVLIFSGRMDVMVIDEGPETSTVSVTAESRLIDLLTAKEWRYTHEDQQIDYPGDDGLEYVVDLQDKELRWEFS